MKKDIMIPVLAIALACALLFGVSTGLSTLREENARREQEKWYCAFDTATASLIALGVTKESLTQRIIDMGGKNEQC